MVTVIVGTLSEGKTGRLFFQCEEAVNEDPAPHNKETFSWA
jgi:hypothetical protein